MNAKICLNSRTLLDNLAFAQPQSQMIREDSQEIESLMWAASDEIYLWISTATRKRTPTRNHRETLLSSGSIQRAGGFRVSGRSR